MKFPGKISSLWILLGLTSTLLVGCVDGPLYSLWYRKQWMEDEKYGATLYTRLEELRNARNEVPRMTLQQQEELAGRLTRAIAEDPSAIYRAEAVRTLGALSTPLVAEGLHRATGDRESSVRIAACQAWGRRGDAQALQVLAQVLRVDDDVDVRIAATRELGQMADPAAVQALALALDDSDPALQLRAMQSLRAVSGEDFGNSVPAWQQYVRGEPVDRPEPPSIVSRLRNLF